MAPAAPPDSTAVRAAPGPTYADLADLALSAPIAAHVRVRRAVALKGAQAAGIAPGWSRYYVDADVVSLIKGAAGLSTRVSYLADVPTAAGIARRGDYIVVAQPVPSRPGEIQLVSPGAQLAYSAETVERLRGLLREASAAGAAPRIVGIGKAFSVPGALPGESETQIFLLAEGGRPVSLNVLRRPGETPRWAVALSEIVDDAAEPPKPDTLLWYRLACTLPPRLPVSSLSEADPAQRQAINADYRLVLDGLGPCRRARPGAPA